MSSLGLLEAEIVPKGTQGFIHCSFKAVSLATLNKLMLFPFARYDAFSLVITKLSFIWFGSTSVDIGTSLSKQMVEERSSSFFVYMQNLVIIQSETSSGN